ncbi:Calx-beta domain-containing protein [Planctomycetota bacterium]
MKTFRLLSACFMVSLCLIMLAACGGGGGGGGGSAPISSSGGGGVPGEELVIWEGDDQIDDQPSPDDNEFVVLAFNMAAGESRVRISEVEISANGTANENTDILSTHLYVDTDGNGSLSKSLNAIIQDQEVAPSQGFSQNNGTINFSFSSAYYIEAGTGVRFFVVCNLNGNADLGETFGVTLDSVHATSASNRRMTPTFPAGTVQTGNGNPGSLPVATGNLDASAGIVNPGAQSVTNDAEDVCMIHLKLSSPLTSTAVIQNMVFTMTYANGSQAGDIVPGSPLLVLDDDNDGVGDLNLTSGTISGSSIIFSNINHNILGGNEDSLLVQLDFNGTAEYGETFQLSLADKDDVTFASSNYGVKELPVTGGVFTIEDKKLTIDDVTQTEGNAGASAYEFTVTLASISDSTITVNYATADGTATVADSDYTGISGTVTFIPGDTTETVTVNANGDTKNETNETFTVNLSNATGPGAIITDSQGVGTITNDDTATISIDDVTLAEGNSGTTAFVFTVSLNAGSAQTITVNYASADGTATVADSDYTVVSGTLTFAPGDTTETITVNVTGDTDIESGETFTVNLSNATGTDVSISDNQGLGTINSDDGLVLGIDDVTHTEGDAGTTTYTFTVSLFQASGDEIRVDYTTTDDTATVADGDYTTVSGTLIYTAGQVSKEVVVNVNGDTENEANEIFTVDLSNAVGPGVISDSQGVGTITNDDSVTISIDDVTDAEGNGGTTAFEFTVSLSAASGQTVTVDYTTADNTATTADDDYTAVSGTLTFVPGDTTETVTVNVDSDTKNEANETFTVDLSNANDPGVSISDSQGVGTINNDDSVTISIDDVTQAEGNSGTTAFEFTVSLAATSGQTITVDYATSDGTATVAGTDYTAVSGTLTFTPGDTTETATVNVSGDTNSEANETFTVDLSNATGADVSIADNQGDGTITNDDSVTISIDNVTLAEGDAGTTAFEFTVSLSAASSQTITVDYTTTDGTATVADGDYTAVSGTVTFIPEDTTETITVNVNGDTKNETSESFTVDLSNATGTEVTISDSQGVSTITNDDTALISIDDISDDEGDAGTTAFEFKVSLAAASGQTITVDYATSDGTATVADSDYTAVSGTLTFIPGDTIETVTVNANGDLTDEYNETFSVDLSNATGVDVSISDNQGAGAILNDDAIQPLANDIQINAVDSWRVVSSYQVCSEGSNVYVVWEDWWESETYFDYSTDGGLTWQMNDISVNADFGGRGFYPHNPQISCSGSNVYVAWKFPIGGAGGRADVFLSKSPDGGVTWSCSAPNLVFINDNHQLSESANPDVSSVGSNVYVLWEYDDNDNWDIYVKCSTDEGDTWEDEIRLDTDASGTGDSQNSQIMAIGSNVYALWLDDRNDPGGNKDVYVRCSNDNGATWQAEQRLDTDNPGAGDSTAPRISCTGSNVYVVWQDDRENPGSTNHIYFNHSTDGGATWEGEQRLNFEDWGDSANPDVYCVGSKVYVVWQSDYLGHYNVYCNYSTDNGSTWLPEDPDEEGDGPIRLDTPDVEDWIDARNPKICGTGSNVYVVWVDERDHEDYRTYMNYSIDGGITWQADDIRVDTDDSNFHPLMTQPHKITVTDSSVFVIWEDGRDGVNDDIFGQTLK